MPKMKTNRAAAERFRKTGTGRIRRAKAGASHMLTCKNRKRLRRLRDNDMLDKTNVKQVKPLIPYK